MTLAIVYSRAAFGMNAPLVTVEAHVSYGMAGFIIVGLPETAVKESRDRIRSAFMNTHFEFPSRRVMINLAPADLPKEGARFDLPIALGILAASGQIPVAALANYEFTGELALSGELRAVSGVLPMAISAHHTNRQLIVPAPNAGEASLVGTAKALTAHHLLEVCAHLKGERTLPICESTLSTINEKTLPDLAEVRGQPHAKRALEIAAAGRHSLLLIGPPGTGKTMLASRLQSILPKLNEQQALEVATIASISSKGFDAHEWRRIPYRSPHHSCSSVALAGGGRPPRPGEISLAHQGILFLDELPEFSRHALECLREPLESGSITISRAAFQTVFPAQFQLIAAMNPCPCGYAGSMQHHCHCSPEQIKRYLAKISGPLLDRIDMHVEVARLPPEHLSSTEKILGPTSKEVRERVTLAQQKQYARQNKSNAALNVKELDAINKVEPSAQQLLHQMMTKFNLSARVYHRMLKVAQTIADLENTEVIEERHVGEALTYRCLDRLKVTI